MGEIRDIRRERDLLKDELAYTRRELDALRTIHGQERDMHTEQINQLTKIITSCLQCLPPSPIIVEKCHDCPRVLMNSDAAEGRGHETKSKEDRL
jgi:hypothetical protein